MEVRLCRGEILLLEQISGSRCVDHNYLSVSLMKPGRDFDYQEDGSLFIFSRYVIDRLSALKEANKALKAPYEPAQSRNLKRRL